MGCSDANLKICRWNSLFSFRKSRDRCLNSEYFLWPTIGHILHQTSPDLDKGRG